MSKLKDYMTESGLSRVKKHMDEHETGFITAFRDSRDCGKGKPYTSKENKARNKVLLAKLMTDGYFVTKIKGTYIENYNSSDAKEVGENTFFVVDIKDKGKLKSDLKKLGEKYEQDSILFLEKGGQNSELIGTNHCPDGYPGYGVVKKLKNAVFGQSGEFHSKIKGRPFILKEETEIVYEPQNGMGKWAMSLTSKQHWTELIKGD